MNKISTKTDTNQLTQSQLLIWAGQMLLPESPMYNMVMTFELNGSIEVEAFREAFQVLVNKSDILRTVISTEKGEPIQIVKPRLNYELEYVDWQNTDSGTDFKNWLKSRSEQVFDISKKTFDSALIQFSEEKFVWYFNQHHIVTDGWSLTVLYEAMAQFYKNALAGSLSETTDLPAFESYIEYEKEIRSKPKKEAVANYWKEKLAALSTPPRLYGEVGKKGSSHSERVLVDLGKERTEQLLALSKEKDLRALTASMSLFNMFSTALFAYLFRVSGQQNLVVGTPSHNRPTLAFKQTPGVFIEIFPMQTDVSPEDTFMDLFQKVRTEASYHLRNAQLGMNSPELSGSFNVLLNFISGAFSDSFEDVSMKSEWVSPGHADPAHHLRLQIHDFDSTGSIKLFFDMNTSVFDDACRENAPQHFLKILDAFLENRNQVITSVNILTKAEKEKILYHFNDTEKEYDLDDQTLLTRFESQVKKTPDAHAILFEDEIWTYRQFNEKANQLGNFLRKQGIGKEDVVAISMERSIEMPLAIYGILKSGAAYLPIDPAYPMERVDFILKDAGAKMLLTRGRKTRDERRKTEGTSTLDLIADWAKISEESTENFENGVTPETLAYLIYTSGSTGNPKGVATEHRAICNRIAWEKELVKIDESDRILQKTPYTFDVSIPEFFRCLQDGAQLVMARPDGHKDPIYLVETIQRYGITTIHFVPSMLTVFLEASGLEKCGILRRFYSTGEAISLELQNKFFEKFNLPYYNLYGPTEAAVEVSVWQCQPNHKGTSVPIGKPMPGNQIYILDKEMRPTPIGTPGELYISGVQLARGYVNRPELTAERFVPNPFEEAGAKMYRSGDLARYRADGVIEFLGRVDFQVKMRGFRIELGEIEAILESHQAVSKAVVVMQEDATGLQYLTAYYSGESNKSEVAFIHHLAARLPEYMIPTQFIYMEEFPVGSAGKVDRKQLPKSIFNTIKNKTEYIAPRNQLEEMVADMWQEVMQIEKIGVHDNFLHLGGHSLTAIRLVSRVTETLELPITVNAVFENPTIELFAKAIEKAMEAELEKEE